ncbi:MAG: FAD-dependent oxidoreductase [Candidatus Omnitrophica bacterium]|nr:FAD-dependent oxidoreductase [Candidatus Omnitrophota bacterium]
MPDDPHVYDLIIIGAGPAGITSAVYAARQQLDFFIITENIGGQTLWSSDVENYTGFQYVSGAELVTIFEKHLKSYNINLRENEIVEAIEKEGNIVKIRSSKGTYLAKTVIVASGKKSRKLGVPGENEYRNKGVFYCAICDGPIFKDKDVAIVGGGNSALDAAMQLVKIAKKIYIINNTNSVSGDNLLTEKILNNEKVTVLNNSNVKSIEGDAFVKKIVIEHEKEKKEIKVEGVFIEVGLIPNSEFGVILKKNEKGEIVVDEYNRTNIPGIFAAGDVTTVPEKQIIIAAGEGSKALLGAFRYLSTTK